MRTRMRIRRLWMLALLLLGTNVLLSMTFVLVSFLQATHADPTFAQRYEQVRKLYEPDTSAAATEADLQRWGEAMQPLFEPVDWFRVALISSVMAFSLVGFMAGRLRLDPRWLCALPLATMLSGPNPVVLPTFLENQGMPGEHLELWQQVLVFGLQMAVVYLVAWAFQRPQPTSNEPSPP